MKFNFNFIPNDFIEITNTNGKVWNFPNAKIIGQGESLSLSLSSSSSSSFKTIPNNFFIGDSRGLDIFSRNPVTLLAICYSSFSDSAIESFISKRPESLPYITIQPILNPLKWMLWSKLISKRENSFAIRGDIPEAIEIFGMENKYAGYVFLVDSLGQIRWKAAGVATDEELKQYQEIIKMLST